MSSKRQTSPAPLRRLPHDVVDRPLVGFVRDHVPGEAIGRHSHPRAQLLYATGGVMRIATDAAAFVVPPGRALWVPAAVAHTVAMTGPVAMRALFLRADAASAGPASVAVLAVAPLLRELILAACAEPLEWDVAGRGRHLTALIQDEIGRARRLPFGVPAPAEPRLARLAAALREDPASPLTLEGWGVRVGASARTLERLFRRDTGMGFARWRQALRLAEAAALMAQGATPARAASSVGYASASAFGAAFRAAFGISPGASSRL